MDLDSFKKVGRGNHNLKSPPLRRSQAPSVLVELIDWSYIYAPRSKGAQKSYVVTHRIFYGHVQKIFQTDKHRGHQP